MISWELIVALAIYNFIMYVTPGPNNSILTASGIKFGFVRSIPNVLGIPTGCLLYTSPSPRDRTRSRMPSSA